MRSVSYVQCVALDFGGSLFPHAICLGDADNDTVRRRGGGGPGAAGRGRGFGRCRRGEGRSGSPLTDRAWPARGAAGGGPGRPAAALSGGAGGQR